MSETIYFADGVRHKHSWNPTKKEGDIQFYQCGDGECRALGSKGPGDKWVVELD